MSVGPLRRLTAGIGLLAMAPIAAMLIMDALTPEAAAMRALMIALAVLFVGNSARMVLTRLLRRVEKRASASADGVDDATTEERVSRDAT